MKLTLAKSLWGVEGADDEEQWDSIFSRIQKDGYTMIECVACFTFGSKASADKFKALAQKYGLSIICQIHTTGGYFRDNMEYVYCSSFDVEHHLASLASEIDLALAVQPCLINCHGGVDAWDSETQVKFLVGAMEIAQKKGVQMLSFETHRQRIFCNPFQTRDLLQDERLKQVKLTADLSHWVVACERQLQSPKMVARDPWWQDLLEVVGQRTVLIHCRVGHPQGPQVPDVTDPHYKHDVQAHLDMWDEIWTQQRNNDAVESICEVEHGPPPYLQVLPHTGGKPVVEDLWKVNNDVANLIRAEFQDADEISMHNSRTSLSHTSAADLGIDIKALKE